jgi:hypothetical protein
MIKNFKLFKEKYTFYNKNKSNINVLNVIGFTYLFSPLYILYDNNKIKSTVNNKYNKYYYSL